MALDDQYFDSVNMDVVKKKYYDVNRVNSLLDDIRQRAEDANKENKILRAQLDELNGKRTEIADMLLEAQAMSRDIADKASSKADKLMADAQREADEIIGRAQMRASEIIKKANAEAEEVKAKANAEAAEIVTRANADAQEAMDRLSMLPDQQEYTVNCVEECFNKLKNFHLNAVDMLNDQWQSFLCGLYTPEPKDIVCSTPEKPVKMEEPEAAPAVEPEAYNSDFEMDFLEQVARDPEPETEFKIETEPEAETEDVPDFASELEAVPELMPEGMPETEDWLEEDDSGEMFDLAELESKISAIVAEMNAMSD